MRSDETWPSSADEIALHGAAIEDELLDIVPPHFLIGKNHISDQEADPVVSGFWIGGEKNVVGPHRQPMLSRPVQPENVFHALNNVPVQKFRSLCGLIRPTPFRPAPGGVKG